MIFIEGKNCWRKSFADRAALLIDADNYFKDFYAAMQMAESHIYILGWDFDSRISLLRNRKRRKNDPPVELRNFLTWLIAEKPKVNVYILIWNPNIIYAYAREFFQRWKMQLQTPPNIHFFLDDRKPISGSHHQKVLVIDDQIAYCGGIDLTSGRWDTQDHLQHDERRKMPDGSFYGPYHDVGIRVQGRVAHDLGDLFRTRWKGATGKVLTSSATFTNAKRFDALKWDAQKIPCAICRTVPGFGYRKERRESFRMYRDLIRAAETHIYIENQYLTSRRITNVLRKRLKKKSCPEITILLPLKYQSGLGNRLLTLHRKVQLWRLQRADTSKRLHIHAPVTPKGKMIYVHSKFMQIDDSFVVIGSSNLSDRSMGLDTECDIVLDASKSPAVRQIFNTWKSMLLQEHKHLQSLRIEKPTSFDTNMTVLAISDYPQPLIVDTVTDALRKPLLQGKSAVLRNPTVVAGLLIGAVVASCIIIGVIVFDLHSQTLFTHTYSPAALIGIFVLFGVLQIPMYTAMLLTATFFSPWEALLIIWAGAQLSAATNYFVGRIVGNTVLQHIFSRRIPGIASALHARQLYAFAAVRLIPVAPFNLVNLVAGAYRARFFQYMAGTFLGELPGSLLLVFFQTSLIKALAEPTLDGILMLVGTSCIMSSVGLHFRKRLVSK